MAEPRERIVTQIAIDQRVYDVNGDEVGTVAAYDVTAGWVTVERGIVRLTAFYVPFSAVAAIDSQHIDLTLSSTMLQRDYTTPPPHTTVVVQEVDSTTGAATTTAVTGEPSGYDGTPVLTARTTVEQIEAHIAAGLRVAATTGDALRVYTVEGKRVGSLKAYDPAAGWIIVEHLRHRRHVPIAVVAGVNLDAGEIYLTVTEADLERLDAIPPAGTAMSDP